MLAQEALRGKTRSATKNVCEKAIDKRCASEYNAKQEQKTRDVTSLNCEKRQNIRQPPGKRGESWKLLGRRPCVSAPETKKAGAID